MIDEAQLFDGIDPVNLTIETGNDAVFTCKVKNILWHSILVSFNIIKILQFIYLFLISG